MFRFSLFEHFSSDKWQIHIVCVNIWDSLFLKKSMWIREVLTKRLNGSCKNKQKKMSPNATTKKDIQVKWKSKIVLFLSTTQTILRSILLKRMRHNIYTAVLHSAADEVSYIKHSKNHLDFLPFSVCRSGFFWHANIDKNNIGTQAVPYSKSSINISTESLIQLHFTYLLPTEQRRNQSWIQEQTQLERPPSSPVPPTFFNKSALF